MVRKVALLHANHIVDLVLGGPYWLSFSWLARRGRADADHWWHSTGHTIAKAWTIGVPFPCFPAVGAAHRFVVYKGTIATFQLLATVDSPELHKEGDSAGSRRCLVDQ